MKHLTTLLLCLLAMLFALPACTDDDDYNGQDEELYVGIFSK